MKRKRIAIVIRGFGENVPNDPIPLWWKFAKKLAKEKDVEKVVILAPLTSGKVTFENGLTVIPTGKNPLKLITEVKRGKYQEVYIVGSYLSVIIYVILSGQKVRKKVYLMRNRIFWNEYFPVLRKYSKKTLKAYYLLSTVNLGYIYRLLTGRWNIAAYIFPSQNSSDAFAKDATIDSKMCFVMPSSPRMSIPYRNDRIPSKKPKALPRRQAGKKRIVYAGRMTLLRGLDILVDAFENMYKKDKKLKLDLLFLDSEDRNILEMLSRKLPEKSYMVKVGKLDDRQYLDLLSQADVFVGPYSFSYATVARPAAVLEAMMLGIPTVISEAINDDFFKDGYNCVKFKTMDAKDLQKKVELILKDKTLRNKIAKNGAAVSANDKFDNNYLKIVDA